MKNTFFLLLMACFELQSVYAEAFELNMADVFNQLEAYLKQNDPFIEEHYNGTFVGFPIEAENFTITGFSNLNVSDLKQEEKNGISLADFVITLPKFSGSSTRWSANSKFFFGDGSYNFKIQDAVLKVQTKIEIDSLRLIDANVTTVFGKSQVTITGLYNDPELSQDFNELWSSLLSYCLKEAIGVTNQIRLFVMSALQHALDS